MSRPPASDKPSPPRLRRERRTVEAMIRMYCRAHHPKARTEERGDGTDHGDHDRSALCPECARLLEYADRRIAMCRFGVDKPTCARCPVHCFRAEERIQIKTVMRYAGPRMTLRHPYLAVRHLFDRSSV